jgi:hypothetical protein
MKTNEKLGFVQVASAYQEALSCFIIRLDDTLGRSKGIGNYKLLA